MLGWSITVFHWLDIVFDGDSLYQNIQLKITEGESSECLLVWHRRACNMPAAGVGSVGEGSRRDPLLIREARDGLRYLLRKEINKYKKPNQKQRTVATCVSFYAECLELYFIYSAFFLSQVQVQRSYSGPCSHSSVPSWCFLHKAVLQSTTKAVSKSIQPCRNHAETVILQWVLQRHRTSWSCFEHSDLQVLSTVGSLVCDRKQTFSFFFTFSKNINTDCWKKCIISMTFRDTPLKVLTHHSRVY